MSNTIISRARLRGAGLVLAAAAYVILSSAHARAATWKGLEPFVSKRTDVERVLGAPVADRMSEDATLEFNVSGGKVTVFFVTQKFAAAKKLPERYLDTVLQIVLQHDRATDTPESMNLVTNKSYEHRSGKGVDRSEERRVGKECRSRWS